MALAVIALIMASVRGVEFVEVEERDVYIIVFSKQHY
jgi:hypothetical protein